MGRLKLGAPVAAPSRAFTRMQKSALLLPFSKTALRHTQVGHPSPPCVSRVASREDGKSATLPKILEVYRYAVQTPLGYFYVATDVDGAVLWCNWDEQGDDPARLEASMVERWYKGVTLSVVECGVVDSDWMTGSKSCPEGKNFPGRAAAEKLNKYFNSPPGTSLEDLQAFLDSISIVYPPVASQFACRIWRDLRQAVPAGAVVSYGELGKLSSMLRGAYTKPTVAPRPIGQAMSRNPFVVIVPCHRVIASNQSLLGYTGGLKKKAWLLQKERDDIGG